MKILLYSSVNEFSHIKKSIRKQLTGVFKGFLKRKMNSLNCCFEKEIDLMMSFPHLGGDLATTRRYLDLATRNESNPDNESTSTSSININCLDPLCRNALLIGR